MRITPASPDDFERLLAVWETAVRATHHFLPEDELVFYRSVVRKYLQRVELAVARDESAVAVGFSGVVPAGDSQGAAAKLSMLFVDPAHHGKGLGRALLLHAASTHGDLECDVNEQNAGAAVFYARCGFVLTGRSPHDDQGKPFPLLHLYRKASLTE